MTRILILARNSETLAIIGIALKKFGIPFEEANSVLEMRRKLQEIPISGTILDVLTTVRTTPAEKAIIQEISDYYPTLRLRWDSSAQRFRGLFIGHPLDREDPLGHFLEKFCRPSPGRTFRENKRISLNLCALLSSDKCFFESQTEKTVTMDISLGGCFLFSNRNWKVTDTAWVRFTGFSEPTPYQVQIRHFSPWGSSKSFPGIGVKFINLNPAQFKELCSKLDLE